MTQLLQIIREIFGPDLDQGRIQEALKYSVNKELAIVGNNVLDLCNSLIKYDKGYISSKIDADRQNLLSRTNHRTIVNNDKAFVEFIIKHDYIQNNQVKIGLDRSDRYLEAIIGAIFLKEGFQRSLNFINGYYF